MVSQYYTQLRMPEIRHPQLHKLHIIYRPPSTAQAEAALCLPHLVRPWAWLARRFYRRAACSSLAQAAAEFL